MPVAVAAGRRTMREQCVTSMGWILVNAQRDTPKADIAEMDSELEVVVSPAILKSGRVSRNKKRQREVVTSTTEGLAEMIVISRLHNPGISKTTGKANYNLLTGNRWALGLPGTQGVQAFWDWVKQKASQMTKVRHSSIAFLKSGYSGPIKKCFDSPLFQHSRKYRSAVKESTNQLTTVSPEKLGEMSVSEMGSNFSITAANNVGEKSGNSVLDEHRRTALILKSLPALQASVDRETSNLKERGELGVRMNDNLRETQKMLA